MPSIVIVVSGAIMYVNKECEGKQGMPPTQQEMINEGNNQELLSSPPTNEP